MDSMPWRLLIGRAFYWTNGDALQWRIENAQCNRIIGHSENWLSSYLMVRSRCTWACIKLHLLIVATWSSWYSTFKLKVSSWFFKLQKSFQYPTNIKIIILWQDFHSRLTIIWSKDKIKKWFVLHFIGKNEEAVKRAYVLNGLKNNKKRILFETSFTCTFQKLPSTFALLVGDTHLFQAF